jgi:hypothetical protein
MRQSSAPKHAQENNHNKLSIHVYSKKYNLFVTLITTHYGSGIQPGIRVPPGVREGILRGTYN